MRGLLVAAVAALLLGALTGCGSSPGGGIAGCVQVSADGKPVDWMSAYEVPQELKIEPEVKLDHCGDPPKELVKHDLVTGTGNEVTSASEVTVNYVGVLWPDGKVFDSTWQRQQPATFPLGGVIPGWSQGLVGMKVGGRRVLVIPPELAYGSQGGGSDIPPDSTLVFVVDMLKVPEPVQVPPALAQKPVVTIPPGQAPPTDLQIEDLVVGTGAEATANSKITVNYVGVAWSTGQEFDSSWSRGKPAEFTLGQLVPGFNQGVEGMKVGGRRQITIPPALGYGDQARGAKIPANETLVFVVDLLAVN